MLDSHKPRVEPVLGGGGLWVERCHAANHSWRLPKVANHRECSLLTHICWSHTYTLAARSSDNVMTTQRSGNFSVVTPGIVACIHGGTNIVSKETGVTLRLSLQRASKRRCCTNCTITPPTAAHPYIRKTLPPSPPPLPLP